MTKIIKLTNGGETLVDDDVFRDWGGLKWHGKIGGSGGCRYVARGVRIGKKVKSVRLHRMIMGEPQGMEVDHINRNTMDNRRVNLRVVTKTENLKNREFKRRRNVKL